MTPETPLFPAPAPREPGEDAAAPAPAVPPARPDETILDPGPLPGPEGPTYRKVVPPEDLHRWIVRLREQGSLALLTPVEQRELINTVLNLRKHIAQHLKMYGGPPTHCRCGRLQTFLRTPGGKLAPYTMDLLNHFADCPDAARYKKGAPK